MFTVPPHVQQRIMLRLVVDDNGCWLWQGSLYPNGYGQIQWAVNGQRWSTTVHRAMYVSEHGPLARTVQVDHLCHDDTCTEAGPQCPHRRCCNPAHLAPSTPRENVLRGQTLVAANRAKTQCPQGHPYDAANTFIDRLNRRGCRVCRSAAAAASHRRSRERARAAAHHH